MWYTKNNLRIAQLEIKSIPDEEEKQLKVTSRYNYYASRINSNSNNIPYLKSLLKNIYDDPNFFIGTDKQILIDKIKELTSSKNKADTQGTTGTQGTLNVGNITTTISNFLIPKNIQSYDPSVIFSEGNYFVLLKLQTNQPGAPILPYSFNFKTQEELTERLNSVADYMGRSAQLQSGQPSQNLSSPEQQQQQQQQQSSQQNSQTNNVADSTSNQNTLSGKKIKINPMLVSPYGNQKMPGYAQIGTEKPIEKPNEEKNPVDDRTKNAITDNANEKIKNYAFNYQIPGTGIYLAYTFEHLNTWLQANQLSGLAETLIDPMRKIPGYKLDTEIEIKPDGTHFAYGKNSVNEPILKLAVDNEMKQFYEKLFSLLDQYKPKTDDINFLTLVKLVDARLNTLEIQDSLMPNYKRTAIPIQVESARTTYNDRIPVDIYLDGNLFRKGYPNNTYITLDSKINVLPRGSHKLLAVDSRPGMPQNIPQSKTQQIEFRVEPNEEVIIFNVIPNRVIR